MKKFFILLVIALITNAANAQWQHAATPFPDKEQVLCVTSNGSNIFAGREGGILKSYDYGNTWISVDLPQLTGFVTDLLLKGSNIYASTYGKGIYLSTDSGNTWSAVNNGLGGFNVITLSGAGNNIYAGVWGGGMYVSSDNGSNWNAINNGLGDLNIRAVVISGNVIFAGTDNGMYRSSDSGSNWTSASTGLSGIINTIAIRGNQIFTGTNEGMFLSTDTGSNWNIFSTLDSQSVTSIAINGSAIFAGTNRGGVYLSIDNGNNWKEANEGMYDTLINNKKIYYSILAMHINGTTLFAATAGRGIWKRPVYNILGTPEVNSGIDIHIYPNPAGNILTISGISEETEIKLFDQTGRLVIYKKYILSNTLGIEWLSPGLYTLVAENIKGRAIRKVVITGG